MYMRTSFRGAKTCKIGEKGCVFGHAWKGHDEKIKKQGGSRTMCLACFRDHILLHSL